MSDEDNFPTRKPAKRVFASELNDATHQFKEDPDDDRSPNWTLLPTGEQANRVFVAGTLTETEDVGSGNEYWRGRIIDNSTPGDNTQPVFVYAGQYQPDAADFLRQVEPPAYVAVIGKPNVYDASDEEDDEEDLYVSLRPEDIHEVDKETRNNWAIETANHTLTRVQRFADAREDGDLTRRMEDAIAEYGGDLQPYHDGAVAALEQLQEDA